MVSYAREIGQSSIAITDHGTLHGIIPFYKECMRSKDKNGNEITPIKPIIGCEVYVVEDMDVKVPSKGRDYAHLVLLAKNNKGLENLIKIVSEANIRGFYYKPRTDHKSLRENSEGLICLSACIAGEIPQLILEDNISEAINMARFYNDIFDDFYLEIQAGITDDQKRMNEGIVQISEVTGIPIVVTNDSHYVSQEDAKVHDVLLAIQTGKFIDDPERWRFDSDVYWIKSEDETRSYLLSSENISPEVIDNAIANTVKIADMCNVTISLGETYYPKYDVPEGHTLLSYLREKAEEGLFRYAMDKNIDLLEYKKRLDYEIDVIDQADLAGYLLTVQDYVNFAKENKIPVGPGRGSAAGSLVIFLLGITQIDPLIHNLSFERFFVAGRKGRPDIDLDFCRLRRQEVLNYVINKYGNDRVAHIGTFGTMGAKTTLRDVARVMGLPIEESDSISKAIPDMITDEETGEAIGITLRTALDDSAELREYEEKYKNIFDAAFKLEGSPRHTSSHAAGVVITPFPLWGIVPLMRNKKDEDTLPITQFNMGDVEEVGFLKFDLLGVEALTTIEEALSLIEKRTGERINLSRLPIEDEKVYELIRNLSTLGVFQVGTRVGKAMCKQVQPRNFNELVDILALGRPGPMKSGQDKEYVAYKNGWKVIEYIHPLLEPILKDTYGVMLYQEQIMNITRDLADFTYELSDQVRKSIGKKDMELIHSLGSQFVEGCKNKGTLDENAAIALWSQMERYGEYCFNRSHAVSYAMISYWMAWLKVYYPTEFMAATLSTEYRGNGKDRDSKILDTIQECKRMGIKILQPNINESDRTFTTPSEGKIRFSIAGIKGVGPKAVDAIFEQTPYAGIEDFVEKVEKRRCNKKVVVSLIISGAFDFENPDRVKMLRKYFEIRNEDMIDEIYVDRSTKFKTPEKYTLGTKLTWEKAFLGGYISGHPLDELELQPWKDQSPGSQVEVAGIVYDKRKTKVKRGASAGEDMGFAFIETTEGNMRVVLFPKTWAEYHEKIGKGKIIRVQGKLQENGEVIANKVTNPRIKVLSELAI